MANAKLKSCFSITEIANVESAIIAILGKPDADHISGGSGYTHYGFSGELKFSEPTAKGEMAGDISVCEGCKDVDAKDLREHYSEAAKAYEKGCARGAKITGLPSSSCSLYRNWKFPIDNKLNWVTFMVEGQVRNLLSATLEFSLDIDLSSDTVGLIYKIKSIRGQKRELEFNGRVDQMDPDFDFCYGVLEAQILGGQPPRPLTQEEIVHQKNTRISEKVSNVQYLDSIFKKDSRWQLVLKNFDALDAVIQHSC
jgi:hypothetical protein